MGTTSADARARLLARPSASKTMACTSRAAAAVPAAAAAAGSRQQRRRAAVAAAPVSSGRRAAIFEAAKLAGVALTASTAAPLAARAEDDGGLFNEFGSTNPLKNPFTPVAAIGLSLLTAMSLLGDKKADKVKEELMEQYGIET